MSIQFEWRNETGTIHGQIYRSAPWQEPPRCGVIVGLLVVSLLAVMGGVTLEQLRVRRQLVQQQITAEILDTLAVAQEVALLRQAESPVGQRSAGFDSSWALRQARSVGVPDRSTLGFHGMELDPVLVEVELAPGLEQAILTVDQTYAANRSGAQMQPVVLRHTHVLVRFGNQWILTTPSQAFWGEWQRSEGRRLTVIYPTRDRMIAARLAEDLDTVLHDLCTSLLEVQCPAELQMVVTLDSDVASLAASRREQVRTARWQVMLPAPTLVGVPVDEVGYQVLLRGYAAHIAAGMVTDIVGWECGNHLSLYQGLLQGRLVCGANPE